MTSVRCVLPPETRSVAAARRFVLDALAGWDADEVGWTAGQLISELATNAVIHANTEFVVEASRSGDRVRICVRDASPAAPALRRYGQESTTGRGLRLVASMAHAWGVQSAPVGKIVWFELECGQRLSAHAWDDGEDVDLDALLDAFDDGNDDVAPVRNLVAEATPQLRPAA